jgi:formate dehydrogenase iron-sulfur subunit
MSHITIYVPNDSAARSVGAEDVADAIVTESAKRNIEIKLIRNGTRGMLWLEPLVEVATPLGRVAYGPVDVSDVTGLFEAGFLTGGSHKLSHGLTDQMEWLKNQDRVTFCRLGITDPLNPDDYAANGGLDGLKKALTLSAHDIIAEVTHSGLRGRGGAASSTGNKWKSVRNEHAEEKFICCNADEGDSGTYADRMVMEDDPFMLLEGMAIAGIAVGATQGYIYLRSEYIQAKEHLEAAISLATERNWIGAHILGSTHSFFVEVRVGAGSYVCGEQTAMLESLEGKRGIVRAQPPALTQVGLWGKPTVVNNVLTLATVPVILAKGAAFYKAYGVGHSHGTQSFQLAGNIRQGGLVEKAFGISLNDLIHQFGGGTATGRPVRAVQVGGPLGAYLPVKHLDVSGDYESIDAINGIMGHGGIVVFDDTVDMVKQAQFAMEFCVEESCGKCTPCRIGSVRGMEILDDLLAGDDVEANLILLQDVCDVMVDGSLCGMGRSTPLPVQSAMDHFREDFNRPAAKRRVA